MRAITWHKEAPDWFANDYGSVQQEHDGWWWYPREKPPMGPFRSKKAACEAAEEDIASLAPQSVN